MQTSVSNDEVYKTIHEKEKIVENPSQVKAENPLVLIRDSTAIAMVLKENQSAGEMCF